MDGAAFITRFREEAMDDEVPPLWSDSLILRYFDEAQTEFCRRIGGLEDSTSALCTVDVPAEASTVPLSPKILKVRAATLVETGRPLRLVSVEEARRDGTIRGAATPRALVLRLDSRTAELVPPAAEAVTIHLDVMRLPRTSITVHNDESEVDDTHIPALMNFALHRAYSRPDADTLDRKKAEYHRQLFDEQCVRADRERGRARKPNGATVFSW